MSEREKGEGGAAAVVGAGARAATQWKKTGLKTSRDRYFNFSLLAAQPVAARSDQVGSGRVWVRAYGGYSGPAGKGAQG